MTDYSYTGSSDDWADTSGPNTASPTLGDYWKQLEGATNQASSAVSSAKSGALVMIGDMDDAQREALNAKSGRNAAEQNTADMTPAGRNAAQTWDHPLSAVAMRGVAAIPEGAAVAGGAMVGGIPGAAAVGGVLGAGHQIDAAAAGIDSLPPGHMEDDPQYQILLQGAKNPEDAALLYRNMLANTDGGVIVSGAVGALGGAAGGAAKLVTGTAGKIVAGTAEAALAGGVQAAGSDIAQQKTGVAGGWQDQVSGAEVAGSALEGAGMGAGMGLVGGVAHGHAQEGTSGNDNRTPTNYKKPKVATVGTAAPEVVPDAVVPDAAQTAALTPKPDTTPARHPAPAQAAKEPPAPSQATPPAPTPPEATQRAPQAQETATPVTTEGNAPAPAPPAPATDTAMPEAPSTLQLQQNQLTSGERHVMVYKGSKELLPLPSGYKRFQLGPDTYDYNPGVYNRGDITKLVKTNKIGEALGLGPVTKDEAITRASQGETPVGVVERAPDGTEVRAAAGTDQTAPVQQAAIEQVATPGNTVAVEPAAQVIGDRAAAQAAPTPEPPASEPTVKASDIGLAPKPVSPVVPTGRVLTDQSDAGKATARAARDKWGRQVAAVVNPDGGTGKNWSAGEREARAKANTVAQQVLDAHPATDAEPTAFGKDNTNAERKLTEDRAKAMVQAAREAGLRFHEELTDDEQKNPAVARVPKRIGDAKDADMNYSPAVIALREAKTVADRKINKGSQLTEFRTRELQARGGDREGLTAVRREQGDIAKGQRSLDAAPADMTAAPTEKDVGGASTADKESTGAVATAVEGNPAEVEDRLLTGVTGEAEDESPATAALRQIEQDKAAEAARIAARRAEGSVTAEAVPPRHDMSKVQVAKAGGRRKLDIPVDRKPVSLRKPEPVAEVKPEPVKPEPVAEVKPKPIAAPKQEPEQQLPAGLAKEGVVLPRGTPAPISIQVNNFARPVELQPTASVKFSDVDIHGVSQLSDATGDDTAPKFGALHADLINRLQKLVGDVPLHFIPRAEMEKLPGPRGRRLGFYDPRTKSIVVAADLTPAEYAETLPHEAIHALLRDQVADRTSPTAIAVAKLAKEVRDRLTPEQKRNFQFQYAFSERDGQEFITQGLTNLEVRDALAKIRISRGLAESLELPKWRIASALQAFTAIIRKALGYPKEQFTALEGLLKTFEQASWAKDPGGALGYAARHGDELMMAGDDPHMVRRKDDPFTQGRGPLFKEAEDHEASDPGATATAREKLLSGVSDQIANVKSWGDERSAEYAPKFQSNDQYRQSVEHLFGDKTEANPVRRLVGGIERAGVYMRKLLEPADKVEGDLWRASRQHEGDDWNNFTKLITDSTIHNVNPDAALDSDANSHLRLPKDAKNESDASMGVWQSRAMHPDLSEAYNALPKDLQSLYQRARDYYAGERDARVKQHVRSVIEAHDPPPGLTREQAADKVFNGTLTEDEEAHYEQFGIGKTLKAADEMQKTRGPYFPLKRRGDYVVTGEHDIPGGAAKEFDTREEAHAFAAKQQLPTKVTSVYYDPATGEKTTKAKGLSTEGSAVQKFRAEVDNKHVEFAETAAKAEAARQAMIDAGVKNVSAVDKVDRNKSVDYGLRGTQLDQLTKAINRRTDLSDAEKARLIKSLEESSVALQRGNRLEHTFLRRRGVAGASTDVIKNMSEFAHASAAFRSRAEFKGDIEGSLADMRKVTEADRTDPDTLARRRAVQEYESRLEGFGSPEYQGKMGPMWQRLMAVSFLKRMLSPAHLALHLTHAPMVSAPLMAGRFGAMGSYRELFRAYNDLGARGAIGEGVKGMARNWNDNGAATNFGDYFRKSLSDQRDKAALGKMFQELEATGHIHPDAGFDVSRYNDKDNRFDAGLSKVDHAFRELTSSTEAVNRYATATAAYRLAVKAGDSHEQAVRYAKDTVANSQGLFSRTNAPPVFRGAARPFLQFKQMPQVLIHLMGKLVHDSFRGETPEIKRQALRSFGTMMGAAALMSGVGGLPQDAAKAVFGLGDALGVTPDWDTEEANLRVGLAHQLGPDLAKLIMTGVTGMGPTGVNVGHRMGYASLLTFGEPQSSRDNDVKSWLWDTMTGAPGSMLSDTWDGVQDLRKGDLVKGVAKLAPAKFVGDIAKAADEYSNGKPNVGMQPIGGVPAALQAFGFEPREVQDYSDAHKAAQDEERSLAKPRKQGVGPKGQKILGIAASRKSKPLLNDYAESYGVQ